MYTDQTTLQKLVTALIMQRFDVFNSAPTNVVPTTEITPPPASNTNGASASQPVKRETNGTSKKRSSPTTDENETDDDVLSSVADSPPPAKRTKIEKAQKETDEEYARRLQAELNRVQGRSTRGGGATTKRKPAPKQRKKKSKATVGSDEDSDVEGGEKKEVKRTGGFHVRSACTTSIGANILTNTETDGTLSTTLCTRERNTAIATADGQKDMGIHQTERVAGPERQATDHL
jgi:upstream activation factor subunit UAF30